MMDSFLSTQDIKTMAYFGILLWSLVIFSYIIGFFIRRELQKLTSNECDKFNKLSYKLIKIIKFNEIIIITMSFYILSIIILYNDISLFLIMVLLCFSLPIHLIFFSATWMMTIDMKNK